MNRTQTSSQPSENWRSRHRGPYVLHVTRPGKKKGHIKSQWLTGEVDSHDVEDDARALLEDPRDSILAVDIWSVREAQFVMTFKAEGRAA